MQKLRTRIREADDFQSSLTVAGIEIDRERRLARRGGKFLKIGQVEFEMLDLLASNPGVLFSQEQLVARFWSPEDAVDVQTIRVKVMRLNKALTLGQAPSPIEVLRGQGCRFSQDAERAYAVWLQVGPQKIRGVRNHGRRGSLPPA